MNLTQSILSFFLPQVCFSCRAVQFYGDENPLCPLCTTGLKRLSDSLCEVCGDPFVHEEIASHVCGECLKNPPPFEWARSVFVWGPILSPVIHAFKYGGNSASLAWFQQEMAGCLKKNCPDFSFDFLIPLPLHLFRLWRRGYNQSVLLGRGIGKRLGIPLELKSMVRTRSETAQALKNREERIRKIIGAFRLKNPERFKGKRVLLIDDVYTTGATLREAAKVLKKAGASVCALTLARTPLLG
ncbi:MAG: ComF family protein [bacterium]